MVIVLTNSFLFFLSFCSENGGIIHLLNKCNENDIIKRKYDIENNHF